MDELLAFLVAVGILVWAIWLLVLVDIIRVRLNQLIDGQARTNRLLEILAGVPRE